MGRKKISTEKKKAKIAITLSKENFNKLKEIEINRSKLINWLLLQHFGMEGQKNV